MQELSQSSQLVENVVPQNTLENDFNRKNLDIVQDCMDLDGKFPQKVELKFILWNHGDQFDPNDDNLYELRHLAEYFVGADIVALEVAHIIGGDNYDLQADYDDLNNYNSGVITKEEFYSKVKKGTFISDVALATSVELKGSGLKLPKFVAVDAWREDQGRDKESLLNDMYSIVDLSYKERMNKGSEEFRRREAITVRQLHQLAEGLSIDGNDHTIAVLYGAAHSLLAVGLQSLGAPVNRVFLAKPPTHIEHQAIRKNRFGSMTEEDVNYYEMVNDRVLSMISMGRRLGLFKGDKGEGDNSPLNVFNSLEALCFGGLQKTLSLNRQKEFEKELAVIEPYLGKKPSHSSKKKIIGSLRQLINLSRNDN